MAGITHLSEIYKKKGREFVERLFDMPVTVNEKLDASAFGVEKDPATGGLLFFKRNTEVPISQIDRTLMRYYEPPIAHFKGLDAKVVEQLPPGWRFGMEYFSSEKPQHIAYGRVPKNGLVLSYVQVKEAGKVIRTLQDKAELDRWADLLEVERAPILFQGRLAPEQKLQVLSFVDTPFGELSKRFKTESFARFVVSVLNPKLKKTALDGGMGAIEGVVFRFGEGEDVVSAKMIDPAFEEMARARTAVADDAPSDMYYLAVVDLANFVAGLPLKSMRPRGRTFEERYINFICDAFNRLVKERGEDYDGIGFAEPDFMQRAEFDLNIDAIPDGAVRAAVQDNESLRRLFKVMLATFRKRKRKTNGIMTADVLRQFNATVSTVHDHLQQGIVAEGQDVPTFARFLEIRGRDATDEDEDVEPESEPFVDTPSDNEMIAAALEAAPDEAPQAAKGPKRVNIIVGRFQPFHNGHLRAAEELNVANGLPCVLVWVHPGNNKSGKSPLEPATVSAVMDAVRGARPNLFAGTVRVTRGYVADVVAALRPEWEPALWGAGADRADDYRKQLEHNFVSGNQLGLGEDVQVMETSRTASGDDARRALAADDFSKFKEIAPREVQSLYTLLRRDVERAEEETAKAAEK